MNHTVARGLPADWLNAWLAAIGIALLNDDVHLSWTREPRPCAQFHHPDQELGELIATRLPSDPEIDSLAIAKTLLPGSFTRKVSLTSYQERVPVARARGDLSLSSSVTDLHSITGELEHSPLDPPAPRGTTLWDRIAKCREELGDPASAVADTLRGAGRRVQANGLGFDHKRFLAPSDPIGEVWVDPVIELLASAGISLIPIRGDGRKTTTRGWAGPALIPGSFTWPVWDEPLDLAAIDAVLDLWWSGSNTSTVFECYESVPRKQRTQQDASRGIASRPCDRKTSRTRAR